MGEQAAVDFQPGLEAAHEGEDGGAVTLASFFAGIEAQANFVIAPDAHSLHLLKKANRFLHPLAQFENVAQDHEAFGPVPLKYSNGLSQLSRLLVDVGQ